MSIGTAALRFLVSAVVLCLVTVLATACGDATKSPATATAITQPQGIMVPAEPFSLSGSGAENDGTVPASITAQELKEVLNSPVRPLVLDVRSRASYDSGHIQDAVSLPFEELDSRFAEIPRDRQIVCYCSGDA